MPLYREKKRAGVLAIIDKPTLAAVFKREAENLMIKFGLKEDRITSLSGGNQQKVLIGRGFAMRPDVIVLNDPARGIDVGAKTELYKNLRTFAEEGRAVIYMSSELEEFIGFASRVVVFRDGTPFDAFDGRNLKPKQVLEAMFGQTDGSGLTAAHGLRPRTEVADARGPAGDGVRVTVAVPKAIKARLNTASGPAQTPRERLVPVADTGVKLQPTAIRIVEFDADGRKSEGVRR